MSDTIILSLSGELLYYIPPGEYSVRCDVEENSAKDFIVIVPHSSYGDEINGLAYKCDYILPINERTVGKNFSIKSNGSMMIYKPSMVSNRGTVTLTKIVQKSSYKILYSMGILLGISLLGYYKLHKRL